MISRRLRFPGGRGAELAGILDLPEGREPVAFALFAHCFTCSKELKSVVAINRVLTEQGIGVLRFDFTGLGESGGDFSETGFTSTVDDLRAAASFLERSHAAPRLLMGHSLGGTTCLAAAGSIAGCRAVVVIGSPASPAGLRHLFTGKEDELAQNGSARVMVAGRPFRLGRSFLDDVTGVRLDDTIATLGVPLLILHAPDDQVVGFHHAERIFSLAPQPRSLVALDRADHLLLAEEDARYAAGIIAAWAVRYLSPGPGV